MVLINGINTVNSEETIPDQSNIEREKENKTRIHTEVWNGCHAFNFKSEGSQEHSDPTD